MSLIFKISEEYLQVGQKSGEYVRTKRKQKMSTSTI